jgi:hypothetical protein
LAKKDFKSFKELEKYINQITKKVIQQDDTNVKNVVVHELIESIEDNVYDAYDSPAKNPYERQKSRGGLTDPDNFRIEPTAEGVAISSSRKGNGRYNDNIDVAEIISGYEDYSVEDIWGYGYEEPREFVEPAREKLRNSKRLQKALMLDLKNAGLDVE